MKCISRAAMLLLVVGLVALIAVPQPMKASQVSKETLESDFQGGCQGEEQ